MIQRAFDETPLHLDFGELAEEIAPCAKMFVPTDKRKLFGNRWPT